MTVRLVPVLVDIAQTIERFRPRVESALAVTDTHTVEDLILEIEDGHKRLYAVIDDGGARALMVLCVMSFPRLRVLCIWLTAGSLVDPIGATAALDAIRLEQDCDVIWGGGREGWAKCARQAGWRPLSRSFEWRPS